MYIPTADGKMKRAFKRTMRAIQATIFGAVMAFSGPGHSADWKDSDCRKDKDESGNNVEVCRDKESIGIFWDDGSFVNGWCDDRDYEIEYKGIKRTEALSWIEYYCD